jgi:opacity protein-like surface antigen
MPTLLVRRSHAAALALLAAAAAAPAAHAQPYSRYQVEVSLDQTGSESMHSKFALGTPGAGGDLSQREAVRYSVAASRLMRVTPRTSFRFGLSLANKGFTERSTTYSATGSQTSENQVDLLYLGAPLTLGYNLVNPHPGVKPFVEAGVVPELLVRQDATELDFDLRKTGLSYLVNFGVKYNLEDGRALMLAPELRYAAHNYSRPTPGTFEFRPISIGLKLGVQF